MRIFSGRLGSREAVCMWGCVFDCGVGVRACLLFLSSIYRAVFVLLFFFFSLFGFFLQCFLFVFPAICFIGHLFVCCSYKCGGICLSLVSEAQHKQASFPPTPHNPSLCPLLFIWTACRRDSVIRSIVWSRVATALLWSALHWLQLSSLSAEVEKTCASWHEMELSWGYLRVSCKATFTCRILRFISTTISEIKLNNVI